MSVMTVMGEMAAEALGSVAPHEHALIDIRNQYSGSKERASEGWSGKVTNEKSELLWGNPYAMRDNLILDDENDALMEIGRLCAAGCNTFVDVTPIGIGRDVSFLRKIALRTGMNVIAGTGLYTADAIPQAEASLSVEALSERFIFELTEGIDQTDCKAGIIGELGTSAEIEEIERKTLKAASVAHRKTDAPVMVHLFPWGKTGLEAFDILESNHVRPDKICLCHTDVMTDITYMTELLRQGVYLEFDNFGKEFHLNVPYGEFVCDEKRTNVLLELCERGYAEKLLLSCDVCLKNLYHRNGGKGYDYIFSEIMPKLQNARHDSELLFELLMKRNPQKYLNRNEGERNDENQNTI